MMALLDQGFASVGVSPRDPPMARRALPGMMASANAAPLGRTGRHGRPVVVAAGRAAPAPKASAFRTAETRPALLRMTAAKGGKPVARMEQGDTSRSSVPARRQPALAGKPAPVSAKAFEKPAAKPVKTASNTRRSG